MQEPKAGRRIVSKGEYVLRLALRGGLTLSSTCAFGLSILCAISTLVALVIGILTILFAVQHHHLAQEIGDVFACLSRVFVMGGVSWLLWRLGLVLIKKSTQNKVVPLTRANTADLPAPDSLVRASQEPAQAQEGVLLRAVVEEAQAGQEGQLLRASVGGQESKL